VGLTIFFADMLDSKIEEANNEKAPSGSGGASDSSV
jgi:hypothetical protein